MDEKPFETMNVIPFVDIMLVLLTIVLTTSSFIATGRLPVNLPKASQSAPEKVEGKIIELGRDGQILFDGREVSLDGLRGEMGSLPKETGFTIRADRQIALQRFVEVAEVLKVAGFTKVAILTETGR